MFIYSLPHVREKAEGNGARFGIQEDSSGFYEH
jgi:hypothetical protein